MKYIIITILLLFLTTVVLSQVMNITQSSDISWEYDFQKGEYDNKEYKRIVLTAPNFNTRAMGSDPNALVKYQLVYQYYDPINNIGVMKKETQYCKSRNCNIFYLPATTDSESISLLVTLIVLAEDGYSEISCLPLFEYNWDDDKAKRDWTSMRQRP